MSASPLDLRAIEARSWGASIADVTDDLDSMLRVVRQMREALAEIAQGRGAYSRDQLTHAENCIEAMKALARAALALTVDPRKEGPDA